MNSKAPRKSSPPPYYWKVSVPDNNKDYMTENYRRMKNIAVEGQKKRNGPLKANFIPGVTKNSKYAHIQSKVTANLRAPPPQKSYADDLINRRLEQSQKFAQNGNGSVPGGRPRASRSSVDLRCTNQHDPFYEQELRQPRKEMSGSASNVNLRPAAQSPSQPSLRILQAEPPDESIYKWRFNDSPPLVSQNGGGDGFAHDRSRTTTSKYPVQQAHRVEYLPCDGICAEETHDDDTNLDSARSNSSRTSRGCNTEETRIIGERDGAKSAISFSLRGVNLNPPSSYDSEMDIRRVESQPHLGPHAPVPTSKPKGPFTSSNGNGVESPRTYGRFGQQVKRNRSSRTFDIITGDDLENGMKALKLQSVNKNHGGSVSSGEKSAPGGDLPHSLGTVPKYLKQRQQEWRQEEVAKQEAERNSKVPPGFISLTEAEKLDHLREFRKNYDSLISELNRIPITIDTIRVRDHKMQIEQKLTRLEEAIKNFSRPVVWIKADT